MTPTLDMQYLFNVLFVALLGVVSWYVKQTSADIKTLQTTDDKINSDLTEMRILVAGQYATRAELTAMVKALFTKLDRIEEKVSQKVDRGELPVSQEHHQVPP
jgi:hypothetical protein